MAEKEIRAAVEIIVADVLYLNGEAPLAVATRTRKITPMVVRESEGYQQLLKALTTTTDTGGSHED